MEKHILFNKKKVSKAVSHVADLCSKQKSMLPILDCVLFDVKDNTFTVTGSNLDTRFIVSDELASPSENTRFCINGNDIKKVLSSISDETVEFVLVSEGMLANIIHSNGTVSLPIFSAKEYPDFKNIGDKCSFDISSDKLKDIVNNSRNFLGNDELRPNIGGLFISINGNTMEYCATDTHVLITGSVNASNLNDKVSSIIINKTALQPIISMCGMSENVHVDIYSSTAEFSVGNNIVQLTGIQGNYPNFKAVIPNAEAGKYEKVYNVGRNDMLSSLKRVSVSTGENKLIAMEFSGDNLQISSTNIDFGKRTVDNIKCESVGHDINGLRFGINYSNLQTCLSVFSSDTIKMVTDRPNKAILFIDEENHPSRTVLAMPMMLND